MPWSVAGGLSMSGFSRSRVTSRGPGMFPPKPGVRLGCGTCGLVCPMAAEVVARSPPAAPTARMSRRETGFMMLSRLQGLLIACNRREKAGLLASSRTPTNTRPPLAPLGSYVLIQCDCDRTQSSDGCSGCAALRLRHLRTLPKSPARAWSIVGLGNDRLGHRSQRRSSQCLIKKRFSGREIVCCLPS